MNRISILTTVALAGVLTGCGGGSSSGGETGSSDTATITPALSQFEAVDADFESVTSADVTPFDLDRLETEGASTVMYNTELDCSDGLQETFFEFDASTSGLAATLCDGTQLEASYFVEDGLLVISDMILDGESSQSPGVDFWGLLASSTEEPAIACFESIAFDQEDDLQTADLIPPASAVTLDCSEESYLFYGQADAIAFVSSNS